MLKGHGKPESAESKIKALEAKLQALEAEKTASTSEGSRNASVAISDTEGTPDPDVPGTRTLTPEAGPSGSTSTSMPVSTLPASLPPKPAGSLPLKPNQETIARGEKEAKAHRAEIEQRQEKKSEQRHHDAHRRNRDKKPEEVPKSTLASLGAGMGK